MKRVMLAVIILVLATTVLSYHARIRWTPNGFIALEAGRWTPLGAFLGVTGKQVAKIETIPSADPQELANQCQTLSNQIMQVFREKKPDRIGLHPGFIEGCPRVNVGLPGVVTFIPLEEAQAEEKQEEERREEEERKKTPPVEIDEVPSENPEEFANQCQRLNDQIMQIKREKNPERVAVHRGFIKECPGLTSVVTIVENKALIKKIEELKNREEETRIRAEEEKRKTEEAQRRAEEKARRKAEEEARRKAEEAAEEKVKAERAAELARQEAELQAKQVILEEPKGVQREIEPPEKWVNEYFKFN